MSGRVLVSHPGTQHAYETAVAAQEDGSLAAFVTSMYDTRRAITDPRLLRLLPSRIRSSIDDLTGQRRHADLSPEAVVQLRAQHLPVLIAGRGPHLLRARVPDLLPSADLAFDRRVARRLGRRWRPTVVHCFEGAALATLRACREVGVCTVLDVPNAHEYAAEAIREQVAKTGWGAEELRRVVSRTPRLREERAMADWLLAPSAFVRDCLLENGVDSGRIILLPYGVDPDRFAERTRVNRRPFRVLYVGSISLRKGVHHLLEAWRRLALRDAELLLVGPADEAGKAILAEYRGAYRWLGPVARARVAHLFANADVFALPTLAEGSALVTYEAMSCGLPLITTPNSGSVARDGREGFIVAAGDIDALSRRILQLSLDSELCDRLGAAGSRLIRERYTWSDYRRGVRRIYADPGAAAQSTLDLS